MGQTGRIFTLILRSIMLVLIWGLAVTASVRAIDGLVDHRYLAGTVYKLSQQYDERLSQYARLLVDGERIANDREYQIELLKRRFGYTERDETPIIVIEE